MTSCGWDRKKKTKQDKVCDEIIRRLNCMHDQHPVDHVDRTARTNFLVCANILGQ